MYGSCLHCTRDLGVNELLETLPIGRRVAFDARQGRLWVICRRCARWNLVPFDTRLEAIDACERIFRDTRTRYSTDNIGLARTREGLELVRVGEPLKPEFASWRYGEQYRRRRRRSVVFGAAGLGISVAGLALANVLGSTVGLADGAAVFAGPMVGQIPRWVWDWYRDRRRRVSMLVEEQGVPLVLLAGQVPTVHLVPAGREFTLEWSSSPLSRRGQVASVEGPGVRLFARRLLAVINESAGSEEELSGAVDRLERVDVPVWIDRMADESPQYQWLSRRERLRRPEFEPRVLEGFSPRSFQLAGLSPADRLALEMWLGEDDEARALAGELALLERQWREAEQLAAIADSLAVAPEVEERLATMRGARGA